MPNSLSDSLQVHVGSLTCASNEQDGLQLVAAVCVFHLRSHTPGCVRSSVKTVRHPGEQSRLQCRTCREHEDRNSYLLPVDAGGSVNDWARHQIPPKA